MNLSRSAVTLLILLSRAARARFIASNLRLVAHYGLVFPASSPGRANQQFELPEPNDATTLVQIKVVFDLEKHRDWSPIDHGWNECHLTCDSDRGTGESVWQNFYRHYPSHFPIGR